MPIRGRLYQRLYGWFDAPQGQQLLAQGNALGPNDFPEHAHPGF